MDAWTEIAFSAFGLSVLVSAVQIGKRTLHANPRALANAGRWSAAALGMLAAAALVWLVVAGRWTQAMLLAAFVLPVMVQSAPRWGSFFVALDLRRRWRHRVPLDLSGGSAGRTVDGDLVRQSLAVLTRYLDQVKDAAEYRPAVSRLGNGSGQLRMPTAEALAVLGLQAGASAEEVREAHSRLQRRIDPELGGTPYLASKIDEARDVLLEHR